MLLLDDLQTICAIFAKKRLVRARLLESAGWCRSGTWYVEGPYARHSGVALPEDLRDSIRGIRHRQASREFVERALPPWRVHLRARKGLESVPRCSIAYLSNGGNWKLFDLDAAAVWSRPIAKRDVDPELRNLQRFQAFFNIPSWRTVVCEGQTWRCDQYLAGPNLAHCSESERVEAVRILLRQFGALARTEATDPDPELTQAAIRTMRDSAPHSLPGVAAAIFADDLQKLGVHLKLVPAHGDLSAQNVFFRDGSPWIIDWDTAGRPEPLLYDVLYLMLREAALGRRDLFAALVRGAFDRHFEQVLSAHGIESISCPNVVLAVHAYLVNFHRKRAVGLRDADASNVEALWDPLRPYFPQLS